MTAGHARALSIEPLGQGHLEQAAELLAARHQADRRREPDLPERFATATATRTAVQMVLAGQDSGGVAALQEGRLVGYLAGEIALVTPSSFRALFFRPRSAFIGYAGHAVDPENGAETYRALYAALAPRWLASGCFSHYVEVPATDTDALDAWYSLGFGQFLTLAVRDTGPVAGAQTEADVQIHQAGREDLEEVVRLQRGIALYQTQSPMFLPYFPETEMEQRSYQRDILGSPESSHWLASRDGQAMGLQTYFSPRVMYPFLAKMATPEHCTYLGQGFTEAQARGGGVGGALLDRGMSWAREAGYKHCLLHFVSANLLGARFWLGSGFRPLAYLLCRNVDERIAWADGGER
ncbi:MAG: GNAT family N-acetyltransferase [Dehalococcoidia bacterium]